VAEHGHLTRVLGAWYQQALPTESPIRGAGWRYRSQTGEAPHRYTLLAVASATPASARSIARRHSEPLDPCRADAFDYLFHRGLMQWGQPAADGDPIDDRLNSIFRRTFASNRPVGIAMRDAPAFNA